MSNYPDNFSWLAYERRYGPHDDECECGSGRTHYALYDDVTGLLERYVCEDCEPHYRAIIDARNAENDDEDE